MESASLPSNAPDATASACSRGAPAAESRGQREGRGWAEFNLAVTLLPSDRYIVTTSAELRLVSATLTSTTTRLSKGKETPNQIPLPERRPDSSVTPAARRKSPRGSTDVPSGAFARFGKTLILTPSWLNRDFGIYVLESAQLEIRMCEKLKIRGHLMSTISF